MFVPIIFGLMLSISGWANKLPGEPPVRTFSMAEYQSNVQNWGAALGPDGLMYVGGGMGLLEYDGVRWTRHDTPNNSRVRVMHVQDQENESFRIWIGSTNQFGHFQRDSTGAMAYQSISDRLPEGERDFGDIRDVVEVDGAIYFSALRHLFRWDGETLRKKSNWDGIFRLMTAAEDRALVVVRQRLHDITGLDWTDDTPPPPLVRWRWDSLGDRGQRMTFIEPWPDGRMLYGTYDHGLFWLGEGEPEAFDVAPGAGIDLTTAWPYIAQRRDDGSLLLATRNIGLLHLDEDGRLIEHISSNNGLPMDVINGLAEDGQGGVWLPQQGVITRVALDVPGLGQPIRTWGDAAGLTQARGMAEHDGQIVLAVGGGLVRLETAGTDTARAERLDSPMIEAWDVISAEGQLLAAGSEGVHRLAHDPETGELLDHERLLTDHYGYRLTPSRLQPVVYAELERGLGLLVQDDQGNWIADPTLDDGRVASIDHRVHHVAEDTSGRVWVGTVLSRFYVLEWQGDELVQVAELGPDEGVPEGYAWPFMLGDRLVLGTFDGGYRPVLDESGDVVSVEPDPDFNNDALGEPRGIYKMASPDGERVLAGIGDGGALRFGRIDENGAFEWQPQSVPGIEVGQNDFIQADDRHEHPGAWVGRAPGLVRLGWPEPDSGNTAALNVTRAGYPEQDDWPRGGPGGAPSLSDDRLPFQKGSLRFEYALAEYGQPDAHAYRVRLDGLDSAWSQWTDETRRDYTNLPGGNYVFQVQARDALGRVSEAAPLTFSVAPPWYLGAPMLAVYAAAALLLLWLAASFGRARREQQLVARQQALEAQVADRTREVRRQAREIRQISDARAAFFANVSHELRTPLTLTRAPLEELARDVQNLQPAQRQHLDMALRNTEAMQSLIGQVLDLHKLDAERMPFHPVRADLSAAVTSTVQRFAVHAKSKGVDLVVEGADRPVSAAFDAGHIATVVTNLVSNALKFAPQGSTVRVVVSEQTGTNKHCQAIEVIDAGPGIAEADRERIFERYQQADATPQGGTGIGLALVRELVELHGGEVRVTEAEGGGAWFRVELPARSEIVETAVENAVETDSPGVGDELFAAGITAGNVYAPAGELANGEADRPTVLIVDDNAELRGFLRLRLGRAYRIVEAGDGKEGLEQARTVIPDAIVTDGMMPELDGLGMTRELKSDPETDFIPVLMLTARGGPDAVVRGMQAGADDYLAKPFDSAELAARIAGLIASRRRLRQRLAEHAKQGVEAQVEQTEDPFVGKARAVLVENFTEPGFSVRDWADLMHMDRTTLFRKFKAVVGRSPDEALREMRLQRAAELLRAKAGNVAEVADAVGFASVSAFSRRFRERFGDSPAGYRVASSQ